MTTKLFLAPRLLALLAVTAGSLLLTVSSVRAQGAFSDNFNTAGLDGNFTNVAGTWTAAGGIYGVTSNAQSYNFSMLTASGDTNYTNFTAAFDITSSYDGGFIFHSDSTASNALVFIVRPNVGDAYFILRSSDSFSTIVSSSSLSVAAGSALHVVLTDTNNVCTANIYQPSNLTTPIDTVTTNANNYSSGYVGFYSYTSNANRFDNFAINVPEPSTWMLLGAGVMGLGVMVARRRRTC